jgi:hypothetical protein
MLNAVKKLYGTCLSILPAPVSTYASQHMETAPKFLTHTLMAMAVCNFFLVLCSFSISFLTFLACFLLAGQCLTILLATTPFGQSVAPRLFSPTEFMLGVCLGITIGGTILSFFLCLTFGRIHAYCTHHPEGVDSCGWRTASLNGIWWWSSCIFWLNFISCFLLVIGHSDISTTSVPQYQYLDQDDPSNGGGSNAGTSASYNQYQGGHFAQPPTPQYGNGGGYNNVPDVQSSAESPQTASHPLQPNVLQL